MIEIDGGISLGDDEVELAFVRASGPGGQKLNKVATAVQLRFNVSASGSLSGEVKRRLVRLAGRRITARGVLVIQASRYRTQAANRADAMRRLGALIRRAATPPKRRLPTRPTGASKARRLEAKRRRGRTKRLRLHPDEQ